MKPYDNIVAAMDGLMEVEGTEVSLKYRVGRRVIVASYSRKSTSSVWQLDGTNIEGGDVVCGSGCC